MLYWNPKIFITGIETVDQQHQEMFKMINELHNALNTDQETSRVEATLKFLQDYIVRHFGLENSLMSEYDYPGQLEHVREHEHFAQDLNILIHYLESNTVDKQMSLTLFGKLSNWLVEHISITDVAMGQFMKSHMN